jgi:hypothetical protein
MFSASSGMGSGTIAGSIFLAGLSLATSGKGILLNRERRGDLGLAARTGVIGGVIGRLDRFIAFVPIRWRAVGIVLEVMLEAFGTGRLLFIASGLFDCLEGIDEGLGRF